MASRMDDDLVTDSCRDFMQEKKMIRDSLHSSCTNFIGRRNYPATVFYAILVLVWWVTERRKKNR